MTGTMVKNLFFCHREKSRAAHFNRFFSARNFGWLQEGEKKLDKDTEMKLLLDVEKWMFVSFFLFSCLLSSIWSLLRGQRSFPFCTWKEPKKDQLNCVECFASPKRYQITYAIASHCAIWKLWDGNRCFNWSFPTHILRLVKNEVIRHLNKTTIIMKYLSRCD